MSYGRPPYGRRRWEITVTVSWNVGNRTTVNKDTAAQPAASVRYTKLSASKFKNLWPGLKTSIRCGARPKSCLVTTPPNLSQCRAIVTKCLREIRTHTHGCGTAGRSISGALTAVPETSR